jgi:2-C-methyl-D-erythritol 4-phosphate cytidylyltransferase
MKKYAVIVAGGTGSRMQGDVPKQFLALGGIPVILYSLRAFHAADPQISVIVVMHPGFRALWESICTEYKVAIPFEIAEGGETRFHSVKNGLALATGEGLVAVHDAARPVITPGMITALFETAEKYGSAIPAVPVHETVRSLAGGRIHLVDRTQLRVIQTPQVFDLAALRSAYETDYRDSFTDDAAVFEASGRDITLADGDPGNIKITTPADLAMAEYLVRSIS